jgi:hypothetical protein
VARSCPALPCLQEWPLPPEPPGAPESIVFHLIFTQKPRDIVTSLLVVSFLTHKFFLVLFLFDLEILFIQGYT